VIVMGVWDSVLEQSNRRTWAVKFRRKSGGNGVCSSILQLGARFKV
jgi:hypothetical protein